MSITINVRVGHRGATYTENAAATWKKYLSEFQVEKFTYLFDSLFDLEKNGLLEKDDIDALVKKMTANFGVGDARHNNVQDVFDSFYECLVDQVIAEKRCSADAPEIASWEEAFKPDTFTESEKAIDLSNWLNMWGKLCYGSAGISDFPIWVQLLPKIFFTVADFDQDGVISATDLKKYYKDFVGIPAENLDKVTKEGYRVMTANEDSKLTLDNYFYCFSNFLLGKSIYGPGKYVFGVFDNKELDQTYKVLYNMEED